MTHTQRRDNIHRIHRSIKLQKKAVPNLHVSMDPTNLVKSIPSIDIPALKGILTKSRQRNATSIDPTTYKKEIM